jgi:uncharacterized protein (DUF305 family)
MPGMATRAELSALGDAKGADAERLFLKLMIEHHEAGIEMAAYAANHAGEQAVRRLAHSMATAQEAETRLLRDLLAKRQS